MFAAEHDFTYSVHPSQNLTADPAHNNDADLLGEEPVEEAPKHVWTQASYTCMRARYMHAWRQAVDVWALTGRLSVKQLQQ